MKQNRPILLVEDDEVDRMLLQRALAALKITNRLDVANDGEEAIEFLRNCADDERPFIVFIDLNMPKMNGLEFLRVLKQDESLRMVPVVVLTTSKEQKDIRESFMLGVTGYMAKPVDYLQFVEVIKTVYNYWTLSETP
jgi:CheY-like chemotaxis protein